VPAPLAVSITLPFVQPSVGSCNSPPPLSTVTLPQLRMHFQSTHEDRQGAEALAESGERIAKSPLQRTLTAHIMCRWAKHEGALAHISLKRSIEMLELQCAQRFPARPADPESSVFPKLFPAPQPEPSQPNVPTEKAKQMHLNWSPLGFMSDFARTSWRLFSHRMFDRLFSAGVSERPSPRCLPTLTVARFAEARCVSILWVIMFSLASSTQVLFAVTIISWM